MTRRLTPSFSHLYSPLMAVLLSLWLIILLALGYAYHDSVTEYREQRLVAQEANVRALARTQRELVNARLGEIDRSLSTLRDLYLHTDVGLQELREMMLSRKRNSPELLDFLLLDANGQILTWTHTGRRPLVSDRDYFLAHKDAATDFSYISAPQWSRVPDSRVFIAMSRALRDETGQLQGVLAAAIDVESLARELGHVVSEPGLTTALIRLDGELVFRMPMVDLKPGRFLEPVVRWQGNPPHDYSYRGIAPIDGRLRQAAYQRLTEWPLLVVLTDDMESEELMIAQYTDAERRRFMLLALGGSLLILLSLWLLHRQRQAQLQLQRNEERYRLSQDAARVGVWDLDMKAGELVWDEPCWTNLGYSPDAFVINYEVWLNMIHPDDLERVNRTVEESIASNETFVMEMRMLNAAGHWQWIHGRGKVIEWDSAGEPCRMIGTCTDLSEKMQAQEVLQQTIADLEQFAHVVSHDLRQPLRMINSFSGILNERLQDRLDAETREYFGYITEGGQRMDEMLQALLEYARVGRSGEPMEAQPILPLVEEALIYLQPDIRATQAQVHLQGEWPTLFISRNEGVRLFQNLLANAVKFHQPEQPPEVTISVRATHEGQEFSICDQGIGIDPAQLERVFQVFQRLNARSEYEGSGVGLSICRKIVERHGGRIWAESAGKGQGCCIRFLLPEHAQETSRATS